MDRGGGGGGRRRRLCMPLAAGRRRDDAIGQGVPFTLLGGTCRGAFRSGSPAARVQLCSYPRSGYTYKLQSTTPSVLIMAPFVVHIFPSS